MGYFFIGLILLIVLPIVMFGCNIVGHGMNWANRAVEVTAQQVDPAELLRKYEWFKDASAQLDSKLSSIKIFKQRTEDILKSSDKTRSDKEAYYLALTEVAGMRASYNQLASEYNSQMSKINWRFCNIGTLPQGATTVLQREYKSYED